jgi:hypothetical protein
MLFLPVPVVAPINSMGAKCEGAEADGEIILEDTLPFGKNETTFHVLALNICCGFASLAIALSVWHIMQHALHYLRPYEQKHIIRILAVIPIYAWTTFFAYVFYRNAIYFELVRDCYAAYAVASYFTLMCHYVAPTLHEQKEYLRNVEPKNWAWPVCWLQKLTGGESKGWLRKPKSGLTWFNICWIGIFQYCVIRTLVTFVAGVTQSFGFFCKGGKNPRYASLWTVIIDGISVLTAMYFLGQVYIQLKKDLATHRPFLQISILKIIVFLTFWQTWLISLLCQTGALKPTRYVAGQDLRIGIPCLLTCVETTISAMLHIWAFPWAPYDIARLPRYPELVYVCGPNKALLQAASPWDYAKAAARGCRWLFHGVRFRKQDSSYQVKVERESGKRRCGVRTYPVYDEGFETKSERMWKENRKTV